MKLTVPGSRAQPGGWIDPGVDRRSDPAGALLATIAATRPKPGGSVLNRRGVIIQAAPTAHGSNTTIRLHPIGPAIGRRGKGRCGSKWGPNTATRAAPSRECEGGESTFMCVFAGNDKGHGLRVLRLQ